MVGALDGLSGEALQPTGDEGIDYVMSDDADWIWLTVKNLSLRIAKKGDRLLVEAYELEKEDEDAIDEMAVMFP